MSQATQKERSQKGKEEQKLSFLENTEKTKITQMDERRRMRRKETTTKNEKEQERRK